MKIFKSVLLLISFAILISGYTQSIEKKYSIVFDSGTKAELKTTIINSKEYVNLDDVYNVFFAEADYNKQKMLISFSECQLIFSPNFFIGYKDINGFQTFQMNELAILLSGNLFIPINSLLKSFQSFKIYKISKNQNELDIKKIKELTGNQKKDIENVASEQQPNVYLLPPKLDRKSMFNEGMQKEAIQLTDNSKDNISLQAQNQNLRGLYFTKVFAEQKKDYIDLHFIANSIIDVYHRPECDGKTVIIRIPNANNNISDFSKAEGVYPILNITPSKARQFQIYTLTLSDVLIKCTSRRNGEKEIIFSLYPSNPKKVDTPKVVKEEKKAEPPKKEIVNETAKTEKPIVSEEPVKVEKPSKNEITAKPYKAEEQVKTKESEKLIKIEEPTKTKDEPISGTMQIPNIEKEKKKWDLDVIVLDPGHGGNDAGAVGITGVYEKNITLKLALKVRELLKDVMPHTKVVMTREDDTFIELYRRGQIANKAEGKLFISIHLNSANKKPSPANGIETYILRPGRNDDAIRVANFENSVIKFEKQTEKYKKLTDEEVIIATMAQSAFVKFSELFARLMQDEVCKATKLEDRGVRQAGFYVLIGASMPNVLFEASFLSNEGDERFANSEAGQNKIARGIVNAIKKYAEEYGKY